MVREAHHFAAFFGWLGGGGGRHELPPGGGLWEEAFSLLHRQLRRRDEETARLRLAFDRFWRAGQAIPDGVVILDGEQRIEWANSIARQFLGIDARRDIGQPIVNLLRQPDFVAYLERGEFAEPLVMRSPRRDATLSVRLIEYGDDDTLLLARDITQQERLDKMRRDFVANVSHELKTPVTVLSGFVETLAEPSMQLSDGQRRRFLGLMQDQAQRMQHLIEDLLALSALESGAPPQGEAPVDMHALVEKLAEEARLLSAGRHRVSSLADTEARLHGNLQELTSAFSNLVSNAVRYTPEGGSVRLVWRTIDGHGVFSVEDSGIGIEAQHLPRLTERFYRVDTSRSRDTGGTGLGLAIVKHVLTRHEATLEVTSEPGRGSTFSAVFPASRLLAGQAARAA